MGEVRALNGRGSAASPVRWVTVFHGSRDGYQVPLALAEVGQLESLVTDWYTPLDRKWFKALSWLLPERMIATLRRRHRDGLPSTRVSAHPMLSVRRRWSAASPMFVSSLLGDSAGRLASSHGCGILAYSYYAHAAFASYSGAVPRIVFQVHPHPASLRLLFEEEMQRMPLCKESLSAELEISLPKSDFEKLCGEPALAQGCIVASNFTKRTLVENGVDPGKVSVIPYGVDLERFSPPASAPSGPFRVLFAGQMAQRKGLAYLLEAWRRLALPDAELVLCGRGIRDGALLEEYAGHYQLNWAVDSAELVQLYRSSDVMCMPSLAEGFGLVYLESLACGTPVIATPNTGGADLIQDGRQGFVVPIRDVDALADRLLWCYTHRAELSAMRQEARGLAEEYPWSRFRRALVSELKRMQVP